MSSNDPLTVSTLPSCLSFEEAHAHARDEKEREAVEEISPELLGNQPSKRVSPLQALLIDRACLVRGHNSDEVRGVAAQSAVCVEWQVLAQQRINVISQARLK